MQARFANGLFDGRRVVGDSKPTLYASVGHTVAIVWNVEKPLGGSNALLRDAGKIYLEGSAHKIGCNKIFP